MGYTGNEFAWKVDGKQVEIKVQDRTRTEVTEQKMGRSGRWRQGSAGVGRRGCRYQNVSDESSILQPLVSFSSRTNASEEARVSSRTVVCRERIVDCAEDDVVLYVFEFQSRGTYNFTRVFTD